MDKRLIVFRADAGEQIGYGHFVRTLALADILKEEFECVFVTQTPTDYQKKEVERICPLIELPSNNSKFSIFREMLSGKELVVLDNYFYSTEYQRKIKNKGCRLVCVDDMHDKHYVADAVINYGLDERQMLDVEPYTKLFVGLDWALIREPFRSSRFMQKREKGHIVISFGGVDRSNFTTKISKIIASSSRVRRITAIVGDAFLFEEELGAVDKIKIERNLTAFQLADLFCRVEFAILSSSTICIEALACKCVVFAGWYTENQKGVYQYLLKERRIIGIGFLDDRTIYGLPAVLEKRNEDNSIEKWETQDISKRYIQAFHEMW